MDATALDMSQAKTDTFVCPGCGERMPVSGDMRTAVLQTSCPLCVTPADRTDFE